MEQPPSLTSGSDQAEYWCYQCDTTASVKTLAHHFQIVCRGCNSSFVESLSSIAVSTPPDHFYEAGADENEIDDVEIDVEIDYEFQVDGDSDNDNEIPQDGEIDQQVDSDIDEDEEVELEGTSVESMLRNVMPGVAALIMAYELQGVSLEDDEIETDVDGTSGAPPAAESVVSSLKTIDVEVEKDAIHCAVCKDLVSVGEVAKELGCGHGYHQDCILPWLGLRNTCPVCRFELPTDDADYEENRKKKSIGSSASGNNPGFD